MLEEEVVYANLAKGDKSGLVELSGDSPAVVASSSSTADQSLLSNARDLWSHWAWVSGTGKKTHVKCNYCGREQQKSSYTVVAHLIKLCPKAPQHVRDYFQQYETIGVMAVLLGDAAGPFQEKQPAASSSTVAASSTSTAGQSLLPKVSDLWSHWTWYEEKEEVTRLEANLVLANLAKGDKSGLAELSGDSLAVVASSSSTTGQSLLPDISDLWSHWTCLGGKGRKAQIKCNYCGREQQKRLETCRGHLIKSCPQTPQHVRDYFQKYEASDVLAVLLGDAAGPFQEKQPAASSSTVAASSTSTDESEKFEEDEGDLDDDMSDLMELPEVDPPTERAIKFAIKILARHSINVRQHMATIVNNIVSKFSILYRFHEFLLDPSTKKPYELGLMRGVLAKHASLVPPQQTKSHGTPNIPVSANSLLKLYDKTIRPVFVHDQQTRSSEAAPLILTLGPESLILNPSDLFPTSIESEQLKRSLNLPESWLNILSNKTVFARHLDRLIKNPNFFCTTGSIWTPIFWLICLWYAGYTGYLSAMTRRAAHAKSVKQGGSASANPRLYRRLLESAKGGRAVHWIPLLPGLVKSTASAHLYELALIKLSKRLGGGFNTQSGNSSLVTLPIMESIPDEVLYEFGVVLLVHAFYNVFAGTAIVLSETTNTTIDLWQTRRKAILAEDEQEMASEAEKPRTIEEILASFN
ncbi:hypothetical protein TYRP_003541 [Tyrophagus putrescentiae]|nr:hypothetical protein TYRP_003541 [Tyrophagus putrescentiae]